MTHDKNLALQALKVLALAADKYLEDADELTMSFIAPNINAAKSVLSTIIEEHFAPEPETEVVAEKQSAETRKKD